MLLFHVAVLPNGASKVLWGAFGRVLSSSSFEQLARTKLQKGSASRKEWRNFRDARTFQFRLLFRMNPYLKSITKLLGFARSRFHPSSLGIRCGSCSSLLTICVTPAFFPVRFTQCKSHQVDAIACPPQGLMSPPSSPTLNGYSNHSLQHRREGLL